MINNVIKIERKKIKYKKKVVKKIKFDNYCKYKLMLTTRHPIVAHLNYERKN